MHSEWIFFKSAVCLYSSALDNIPAFPSTEALD